MFLIDGGMIIMKNIFIFIGFLGFVLILGTAGASDMGTISFGQVVLRIALSLAMVGISFFGIKRCNRMIEIANRRRISISTQKQEHYKYCI